ncbi:MAG: Crp/Fnr family transcriptional regulator [Cyclobacteriaceae bacterium]|jgi:CRP-like cAMP-binding protein|nr:Crp/Fnr family transcriptional regulator [Cyclobacteriaceae bacterium]HQQ82071.1 Crp/Fnr family transcriptional regulator [Cyclobacteriaceae bacterium]
MHELLLNSVRSKIAISDEELKKLLTFFFPRKIRKRQYVLNAGDVCQHLTFVESGLLRSFYADDKANEHVVQFASEGWWITDMGSFFSGEPAMYNIEALEDTEMLVLPRTSHDMMMDAIPAMERYFRLLLQNSLVASQKRLIRSMKDPAESRYLTLINDYHDIANRAPLHDVASYLGITPETLSRIRRQLSQRKS